MESKESFDNVLTTKEIKAQINKAFSSLLQDPKATTTTVNHPSHYNAGKYEVIDVIEDWSLGFNLGNAVKYIARADHKGDAVTDLEKAEWYIRREIERRKGA